nr:MAG TPA: hypothetical protein [Caudoviricetes sp.]
MYILHNKTAVYFDTPWDLLLIGSRIIMVPSAKPKG